MKQTILSISFFLISFLNQGCQQTDSNIFDLQQETTITTFVEDTTYFSHRIILNAIAAKNNIFLITATTFSNFTANAERDIESIILSTNLSFYKKHCLSKNYMALSPLNYDDRIIEFHSTNKINFFDEAINLRIDRVGGIPSDPALDYSQFNTTPFDNIAINEFDNSILPVIKKTDANATVFILFDLRALVGSANPFNLNYPYNSLNNLPKEHYQEIILPQAATNHINRMESFHQNFFVSTSDRTYLIRPDGSFRLLMEESANDFFEYNGKIYADFGDQVAFSEDDGESWNLISNTPVFSGFREFQDVYGHLIFFNEDQLYAVNPDDFSFTILDNKGVEDRKITAVLPFYQRVYIATLSGLFHKPIEALEL